MSAVSRVGIVGCGIVGSGVAEVFARAGLDVVIAVPSAASAAAGRRRILKSLDRAVLKSSLTDAESRAALERISFRTDMVGLADRQLVLEAVPEHEPTKLDVLAELDKTVLDPDAILASATSAIPIVRLARVTHRPGQVVGLHFFTPVPALPLVEIVSSVLTREATSARADAFATKILGKQPIHSPDRAGFVVNALLIPYLLAAIRMVECKFATAETIDRGMVLGCAHPIGPLRLADMIGLDTVAAVSRALYDEFRESQYAPPALLSRMVEAGWLGKKSGRGFFHYGPGAQNGPATTSGRDGTLTAGSSDER